jgi:hypothetical protein
MRPLLSDDFVERHIPMEMIGATMKELYFLCGPCRGVISEMRLRAQSVDWRRREE